MTRLSSGEAMINFQQFNASGSIAKVPMADSEEKALKLRQEADKKMKFGGGFFSFLSGGVSSRADEACELYVKSANLYKIAKKWQEAGDAFVRAAEVSLAKSDYKHEGATNYVEASNCYRKSNPKQAIDCLLKAVDIYSEMGRFSMAAKYYMNVAELYEGDEGNVEKSLTFYERAADYYKGEESKSAANKCLLKVAQFSSQMGDFKKAADIFEDIGRYSADNQLLKYSAKDHFFKASLCQLSRDLLDGKNATIRYGELCSSFLDSREYAFLNQIITAMEEQNPDEFTNAVKDYDRISRLDSWATTMLLNLKRACGGEGEESDIL